MFYDQAKIYVKSGDGGNGIVAFRREKYVPRGGPSGGDGGRGGSIYFKVDEGLSTLMDFKYRQHYRAERGEHGQGKNMHGANAAPLVIKVPPGTVIKNAETGEILGDLIEQDQECIIARGGRGGRGNARFSNATNRAPAFAEKGAPGEEKWILLELKLLADVGLVGMPNAGKSTLISRVSAARPKIADYPFTTLVPNLGVVKVGPGESFVLADIPGLIAGAHEGAGLGHEFLRHVERTRVLLFVLDCSGIEETNPLEDYSVLVEELRLYRPELLDRPRIIAANKKDMPGFDAVWERINNELKGIEIYSISALTGDGLDALIARVYQLVQSIPREAPGVIEDTVITKFKDEPAFTINRVDGVFEISGERIERLVAMTDLDNDEALARFQRTIKRMGLEDALRERGAKTGDPVRIKDLEFEYME
ncbi:MAG: GTPase ObgE [Chitinophagales bacterium]